MLILDGIQRIKRVVSHYEKEEEKSHRNLIQLKECLDMSKQQLQQILVYRDEYKKSMDEMLKDVVGPGKLYAYNLFINKINLAVSQQEKKIAEDEIKYKHSFDNWLVIKRKCKVLEKMVDKKLQRIKFSSEKNEQKLLDELSSLKKLTFNSMGSG